MGETSTAQVRNETYLTDLFKEQGGINLFAKINEIKEKQKNKVIADLNSLSAKAKLAIINRAKLELAKPWPLLTLAQFNEFKLNGNRSGYEANYFARRSKLTHLIIGEIVEQKGRFLPDLVNGLGLVLEESTWALPAHMYLQKAGEGLPDVNEPVIDLFVGQTAMVLAWTKLMMQAQLDSYSPLLVKRIDQELERRVFDPYLERNDFWWMGFNNKRMNNWNIYVNTNVLISALLASNDTVARAKMVEKSVRSVDKFLNAYPADGGCDEGPSYWGIAGGALVDYLDQLAIYSNQKLDFSKSKLVHSIAEYIYKVHIDQNYYVNFADAPLTARQDVGKIYRYGKLFNDEKLVGFASYLNKQNKATENFDMNNLHAFFGSLALIGQFNNIAPLAPMPKTSWFPDLQVLAARQNSGTSKGLFFAAKAGTNFESHNHNDVGNFILYKNGNPVIVDAGVGTYTKQTFSADRYRMWYMQSAWHNTPTVNGEMQKDGKGFFAKDVCYDNGGNLLIFSMDLATAYPKTALVSKWERKFTFNTDEGKLKLNESWQFKQIKKAAAMSFIVNGNVSIIDKGRLKLTSYDGSVVYLKYPANQLVFSQEHKAMDDPKMKNQWPKGLTRITLSVLGDDLSGSYEIEFN